jgi:hypothetical protein
LKKNGGFNCERTKMSNINLHLHNLDIAVHPRLLDSAGYLGTFRSEQTATTRMPAVPGDAYVYFIAPTPNMIDVNASLGAYAKRPENREIAAMGKIEYAQIRGWRIIRNGVPGRYVRNPDYRWDIFDQTSTAGAQPALARFPIDSDAWRSRPFNSSVSSASGDVSSRVFNVNPDFAHALFYDSAWHKVRDLDARQNLDLDYRGPLKIQAYGASDRSQSEIYLDDQNTAYVNTMYSPNSRGRGFKHYFALADDGRFHVIDDFESVLRVGGDGYIYAGRNPTNRTSLNGVFEYVGGRLIHQEDRKFLTTGLSSFTPFVDSIDRGWRSQWYLIKPDRTRATPPPVNEHSFSGQSAGTPEQLYSFYLDPDNALPPTATHFVTLMPGIALNGSPHERFLDYVTRYTPVELQKVADWLRLHQAAWLFKDGFYAVSEAPGELDVRTLGGTLAFRAEGLAPDPGKATFRPAPSLASNYRIPNETWEFVRKRELHRASALTELTRQASHR